MCLSAPTDSLSGGEEEEEEEDNDDDDHGDVAQSSRIEVNSSTPSLNQIPCYQLVFSCLSICTMDP